MDTRYSSATTRRATGGFTMMEMMIAVAILVIIMGVAFVGVINYQRSMKQIELDGTAKELFIAAQNHLSMAKNQGVLKDADAASAAEVGDASDGEGSSIRYWYVGPGDSRLTTPNKSTLYEMLPSFSIDDTVRLGGSYVIVYDLQNAQVESVFYSDQSNLSNHVFSNGDYSNLPSLEDSKDEDGNIVSQKDSRLHAFEENCVIGWYGGEGLNRDAITLYAPNLKVINAERLLVNVSFTRTNFNKIKQGIDEYNEKNKESSETVKLEHIFVRVFVRGDTSRKSRKVYDAPVNATNKNTPIILDDITTPGKHFAERFCKVDTRSDAATAEEAGLLIPGENISVYAEVYSNHVLSKTVHSVTKHTNSLFASITQEKDGTTESDESTESDGTTESTKSVAAISNIRHLENLDSSISGYDLAKLGPDGATTARQIADIRWRATGTKKPDGFTDAIVRPLDGMDADLDSDNTVKEYANAESVLIYLMDSNDGVKTGDSKGTFVPVVPQSLGYVTGVQEKYVLDYEGNNKKISNVKIDVAGSTDRPDAGIFSTLEAGSSVKNLELIDCSVKTSNGNAGTLLGSASGKLPEGNKERDITIENVLVHDSSGTVESKVEGTAAAGGLVGKLTGEVGGETVTINGCGVAVIVSTAGTGTGADNAAGGLIGLTSGPVAVTNSYAGGHTKKDTGMYDTDRFNVVATNGAAGGLVGEVSGSGAKIQHCYATTSVSRGSGSTGNIGGLVGKATNATITNCYATGLIGAAPTEEGATLDQTRGAFAGNLDSDTANNLSNNKYYEIINDAELLKGTIRGVGNNDIGTVENNEEADEAKLVALDKDLDSYNAFYKAAARTASGQPSEVDNAAPYDPELTKRYKRVRSSELTGEPAAKEKELAGRYNSTYPLETIYMLNPSATGPWAKSHYGDWPSPETLVVNTKQ